MYVLKIDKVIIGIDPNDLEQHVIQNRIGKYPKLMYLAVTL